MSFHDAKYNQSKKKKKFLLSDNALSSFFDVKTPSFWEKIVTIDG